MKRTYRYLFPCFFVPTVTFFSCSSSASILAVWPNVTRFIMARSLSSRSFSFCHESCKLCSSIVTVFSIAYKSSFSRQKIFTIPYFLFRESLMPLCLKTSVHPLWPFPRQLKPIFIIYTIHVLLYKSHNFYYLTQLFTTQTLIFCSKSVLVAAPIFFVPH